MKSTRGGLYNFFIPDTEALNAVIDIGAASADHGEWICIRPCRMREAYYIGTAEAASGTTTAPTVVFTKRPTPLSATGEAVVKTLTIPSGTAVGVPVRGNVDNATEASNYFQIGDALEISHTVGVGTPTGQGVIGAVFEEDPEYHGNATGLIESAT